MIYEFLEKETKILKDELQELILRCEELEVKKQENKKFIQILNESLDRKYAGFTPYEVTKDEDIKIQELRQQVKNIEEELFILKNRLPKLENKVHEYEKMAEYAFKLEN